MYDTQTPQEVDKSATTIVMLIILSLKIVVQFCTYVCFFVSYVNDILHVLILIKQSHRCATQKIPNAQSSPVPKTQRLWKLF